MHSPVKQLRGRDAELALLRDRLHAAAQGRGGVVVVSGEAGIGKSALAEVIADDAGHSQFRVLSGRAWELGDAPAYFPVRSGLRALGVAPAMPAASDADAFGLWEDVLEALARDSAKAPIFWLIEDLHAADAQSLELLAFLAQPLRALCVLVLTTIRTGDSRASESRLPRLTRLIRDASTIELMPLRELDVVALAGSIAGRALPAGSIEAWMARTGGNPLFVVECARAVRAGRSVQSALPETVVQVVVERVRSLPAATRALLEQGAVLGRDFSAAQVARLSERLPAVVIDGLLPALRAGLLEELGPGRFRFGHALVRDAIEEAMPANERRQCHARAEAALAAQGDAPEILVERARHAIEGLETIPEPHARELVTRAVAALEAEAARDRAFALWQRWLDASSGPPDAAALLETARLATAAGNHGDARRASEAALALAKTAQDPVCIAKAALALGAALRPGVVDAALVRALEQALSGLSTVSEPKLACRVRARLAAAMIPAVEPRVPLALGRDAIAAARASGDDALLREVLFVAGSALTDFTDVTETYAIADELLSLSLAAGDSERALRAYARRALDHLALGDFARYDEDVERTLALGRASGHPSHAWRPLLVGSMRALARGRFEESERFVTEVEQMASLTDDPALPLSLWPHKSCRTLALDDEAEIRAALVELGPHLERMAGAEVYRAPIIAFFAARLEDRANAAAGIPALMRLPANVSLDSLTSAGEAVALAGTQEQRAAVFARLLPYAEREVHTGHVPYTYEGPVARVLGLLEASLGRNEAADARLEAAREHCRSVGFQPWVARLSLERGRVLLAAGRGREARSLFDEAVSLASELSMSSTEARARRAAGEDPSARKPSTSGARPDDRMPVTLTKEGELWRIAWADRTARVRDSRGLQLLAKLVAAPGERIHALALASNDAPVSESDAGEALDPKAVGAYRERLSAIDDELSAAELRGDLGRVEQHRHEREMLAAEIARAVGLGGRLRKVGSATEKARINVTRRLKDAVARIAEADAELGRHLEAAIRTGTYCSYGEKP